MTADPLNPAKTGLSLSEKFLLGVADRVPTGVLTVIMADGREFKFKGERPGPQAVLRLKTRRAARRAMIGGQMGFAEAFMDGEWDTPDLAALLQYLATAQDSLGQTAFLENWGMRLLNKLLHLRRANTKSRAKRNIQMHYDLGNAFYAHWLDPSMTYSSAIFPDDGADLEQAQHNKYKRIADVLGLVPGLHVLEIGCGWGGFAEYAAKERGCRVTGITISPAQLDYAQARMKRAGLENQVELKLIDYRDVQGSYDRIASIEMIEAVGEEYWPAYFTAVRERLKPGGVAAIQAITIHDKRFPEYRRSPDFIQRYIFPGGMLPTVTALKAMASKFDLAWQDDFGFGTHYADTLANWRTRFEQAWPEIKPMGFDERFRRLWNYYLSYCEAGFRHGGIDVMQIALHRP